MKQRLRTSRHSFVIPSVIPTQLLNQTKLGDVQPPLDGCRFIESRQISTYCVNMILKKEMSWTAPYRDAERDTSATWTHAAVGSRLAPTGPTAETGPGLADRRHQRGRSSRSLRFRRFARPPSKKKSNSFFHSFTEFSGWICANFSWPISSLVNDSNWQCFVRVCLICFYSPRAFLWS